MHKPLRIEDCFPVPSPEDVQPLDYVQKIRARNKALLGGIKAAFDSNNVIERLESQISRDTKYDATVHLMTTGSDGREEKKGDATSPIEAIVLVEPNQQGMVIPADLKKRIVRLIGALHIFGSSEIKILGQDDLSYDYTYIKPQCWPTRMIDAHPLTSRNVELFYAALDRFRDEILSPDGNKLQKAVHDRFTEYRGLCKRNGSAKFQGQTISHFDSNRGELYYSPNRAQKTGSVKFGPLRTVQMLTAYRIIQRIRNNPNDSLFLTRCPTNTVDKINFLQGEDALKLTHAQTDELSALYQYFLWCFYLSEHEFSKDGASIVYLKDPQQFRENLANLIKLVELHGR